MSESPNLTDKAIRKLLAANKTEIFDYVYWIREAGAVISRNFRGSKAAGVLLLDLKYDLQRFKEPKIEWFKCEQKKFSPVAGVKNR